MHNILMQDIENEDVGDDIGVAGGAAPRVVDEPKAEKQPKKKKSPPQDTASEEI
jgi:hypothetical protein